MHVSEFSQFVSFSDINTPGTVYGPVSAEADSREFYAAFFREAKEDNVRFRELICQVRSMLDGESTLHLRASDFTNLLRQLRDQLGVHFLLEEGIGRFDDAVPANDDESTVLAKSLRDEHDTLYKEISCIVDAAKAMAMQRPNSAEFRHVLVRTRAFCDQLDQHECREDELILRSFLDEISGRRLTHSKPGASRIR